MKPEIVVTDFDGVVGNSLSTAIYFAGQIVKLFDTSLEVKSFNDYRRFLGKKSDLNNISIDETETLRKLHRLLMKYNSKTITLFTDVLNVYAHLRSNPIIVSSAYSGTVKSALGSYSEKFEAIYGCDAGQKELKLAELKKNFEFIYVTDTITDVKRCKDLSIPVIATTWGYDSPDVLTKSNPDFIAFDFNDLNEILINLNLI